MTRSRFGRRGLLVVAALAAASTIAWFALRNSPEDNADSITYRAVGTLVTTKQEDRREVDRWASYAADGEVPAAVADVFDVPWTVQPAATCGSRRIVHSLHIGTTGVCIVPITTLGAIRITATDRDSMLATGVARALGQELIEYLEAEARGTFATARSQLEDERASIRQTISDLTARLDELPPESAESQPLRDERDDALMALARVSTELSDHDLLGPPAAPLEVLHRTTAGVIAESDPS